MLVLLGLGANAPGRWGGPRTSLARAIEQLALAGVQVIRSSRLYSTAAHGPGLQDRYLNGVVLATTPLPPAALIRLVKRIERQAGRRLGRKWGPRPLDIDLLDCGGRRIGWPPRRRERGDLILPHPEMHARAFVLVPLNDVAPHWRHPALGLGARALLARLVPARVAEVRPSLDFEASAWHKSAERVLPPVDSVPGAFSQPHHR
jgi:2-amino-4-hydroxy-6-hydroxymethyldihydropteridine diphosphokinase